MWDLALPPFCRRGCARLACGCFARLPTAPTLPTPPSPTVPPPLLHLCRRMPPHAPRPPAHRSNPPNSALAHCPSSAAAPLPPYAATRTMCSRRPATWPSATWTTASSFSSSASTSSTPSWAACWAAPSSSKSARSQRSQVRRPACSADALGCLPAAGSLGGGCCRRAAPMPPCAALPPPRGVRCTEPPRMPRALQATGCRCWVPRCPLPAPTFLTTSSSTPCAPTSSASSGALGCAALPALCCWRPACLFGSPASPD